MKIGIDFDGVIADSQKLKADTVQRLFGITLAEEDFKRELLVDTGILSPEQYLMVQEEVYGNPAIGLLIRPVSDAFSYIKKLQNEGHSIMIITSRFGVFLDVAQQWAKENNLKIPFISVPYPQSKEAAARANNIDVFIDDDLDKLAELVDAVQYRFLYSWHYNLALEEKDIAVRVNSWSDFYREIQKILNVDNLSA